MADIPVILLAAGSSSRMGQPKQLLLWGEQTLIEHQLTRLIALARPVFVVLGAHADLILPVVSRLPVNVVVNTNWESGMGSSVACGIARLEQAEPNAEGTLITLVDQPLVPAKHYNKLLETFVPGSQQIIASTSAEGWTGVPAIFDKRYFGELKNLRGEKGAKTIIQNYPSRITKVFCSEIIKDIDTLEAYQKLHRGQSGNN